jgi:hypothetical protein
LLTSDFGRAVRVQLGNFELVLVINNVHGVIIVDEEAVIVIALWE